jgi:hypothetical protein
MFHAASALLHSAKAEEIKTNQHTHALKHTWTSQITTTEYICFRKDQRAVRLAPAAQLHARKLEFYYQYQWKE